VVIDLCSTVAELGAAASLFGIVLVPVVVAASGLLCLAVVVALERYWAGRTWKAALVAGGIMGLLTALPFFFLGGLAGLVALLWAGVYKWHKPRQQD
jgi:hypothetical protein